MVQLSGSGDFAFFYVGQDKSLCFYVKDKLYKTRGGVVYPIRLYVKKT